VTPTERAAVSEPTDAVEVLREALIEARRQFEIGQHVQTSSGQRAHALRNINRIDAALASLPAPAPDPHRCSCGLAYWSKRVAELRAALLQPDARGDQPMTSPTPLCRFGWRGVCPDWMQTEVHLCSKVMGHSSRRHQCSCGETFRLEASHVLRTETCDHGVPLMEGCHDCQWSGPMTTA